MQGGSECRAEGLGEAKGVARLETRHALQLEQFHDILNHETAFKDKGSLVDKNIGYPLHNILTLQMRRLRHGMIK